MPQRLVFCHPLRDQLPHQKRAHSAILELLQEANVEQTYLRIVFADPDSAGALIINEDDFIPRVRITCIVLLPLQIKLPANEALRLAWSTLDLGQLVRSCACVDVQQEVVIASGYRPQSHFRLFSRVNSGHEWLATICPSLGLITSSSHTV